MEGEEESAALLAARFRCVSATVDYFAAGCLLLKLL